MLLNKVPKKKSKKSLLKKTPVKFRALGKKITSRPKSLRRQIKIRQSTLRMLFITAPRSVNRLLIWDKDKAINYVKISGNERIISTPHGVMIVKKANKVITINKSNYGAAALIVDRSKVNNEGLPTFFDYTLHLLKNNSVKTITEDKIITLYSNLFLCSIKMEKTRKALQLTSPMLKTKQSPIESRGYVKHLIRLRYRWFFKPRLAKFKLFKKFLKRCLKRFRKIHKNRLFVEKFRNHFSRLTGFKEKSLFKLWLPFRRNYNQYWSTTNAVLRFSQSLILTPPSFLVFLRISPSLAASRHLVKSGALSINGLAVTNFTPFRPGDIMQLDVKAWKAIRSFFSYQRWSADFRNLQQVPFLYIDWSSMIFFMVRWPHKQELVAPSFLSERWVRYYIRLFPVKTGKFKRARSNWKIYKKILTKQ